jgi:dipeptidyl aminopeptidase/acylaminoacyl peptidase
MIGGSMMTNAHPLDLAQLLQVPHVEPETGFDLSPDGKSVAFSWNRSGAWEIYQMPLDQTEAPRQITSGPGAKFGPSYSPDGLRLAYVVDLDGSERFDVWVCDLQTGRAVNLTPGTDHAIQPKLSWSPDSTYLAFISDQSGRFGSYLLPLPAGLPPSQPATPVPFFDQGGPHWEVHGSPDGRWLAVTCEGRGQDFCTFLVPTNAPGEARQIAIDGNPINAREVSWSPDGSRLAFSSDYLGGYQIGLYEMASDAIHWLTAGKGEKSQPDWSPDGRQVAYVLSDGPQSWLAVQALEQNAPRLFQVEPGIHYTPAFTPDGERLVFVFDNPRNPDDLWALHLETGSFEQLTHSLPLDLAQADFSMPQHVEYPSPDGQSVPALLYLPPVDPDRSAPPPAVVVIHGGPTWLFGYLWYPIMTHLASRGWVVLAPNYRGSSGYGREWQLANRFDIGRGDTMDVVAGVDYLVRQGLADPQRIAVTGRSHGGYLTMSCLTNYPDRWAGGSAVVPFLNWFTSHANSRPDLQHWDTENMGSPVENEALWRERSPFFFLDRVQAPIQLICGANDPRCPASESIQARDALLALGKQVDFLLYPDEGHAFLKIENVVEHELRRVAFLAACLE